MTTTIDDQTLVDLRRARQQHAVRLQQGAYSKVHAIQRAEAIVTMRAEAIAALAQMRQLVATATPALLAGAEEFEAETYRTQGGRVASVASDAAKRCRSALVLLAEVDQDAGHIQTLDDLSPDDVKDWVVESLIRIWWDRLRGMVSKPGSVQTALDAIPVTSRELHALMAWQPAVPSAGHVLEPRPVDRAARATSSSVDG